LFNKIKCTKPKTWGCASITVNKEQWKTLIVTEYFTSTKALTQQYEFSSVYEIHGVKTENNTHRIKDLLDHLIINYAIFTRQDNVQMDMRSSSLSRVCNCA